MNYNNSNAKINRRNLIKLKKNFQKQIYIIVEIGIPAKLFSNPIYYTISTYQYIVSK